MKTILIIEDSNDIRENITEALELEGFDTISEKTGKDGVALAIRCKPSVIICDIRMPEMDGYGVLSALKSNSITYDIPFIFISASVERKDILTGLKMGADGYITKPFALENVFSEINKVLSKKSFRTSVGIKMHIGL